METDENAPLLGPNRQNPVVEYSGTVVHNGEPTAVEPEVERPKESKSKAAIIIPLAIGIFLAAMDQTIVASSYASIGSEMNQLQSTSWIATGYMLTLTSFQPLYGKLSDIFGRKSCLLFSYAVFAMGCLACGLSRNMTQLITARAVAGLGGGGMTTVASILVSDIVPLRERGTWQGLLNIVFALGSATGAPLGGILSDGVGWRWAFLAQVPLAMLAIVSVNLALHVKKPDEDEDDQAFWDRIKRVDFVGALLLVSAVFTLLLGLDKGGNVSWTDRTTIIYLWSSFLLFVWFAIAETSYSVEPFAPKRIVANRALLASYLCNFFSLASSMCTIYQITLYLQAVKQFSAKEAGASLLPSILASVLGSLGAGIWMQKTGRYYWLTVGSYTALTLGSAALVALCGIEGASVKLILVSLAFLSLGNGIGITTTLISLIANAAPEDQAIVTAVSYLFRSLGSVVGVSVGSTLVQNALRAYLAPRLSGSGRNVDEIIRNVRQSLGSISDLDPTTARIVRLSYADATRVAFIFSAALAAATLISSWFIKEKSLARR